MAKRLVYLFIISWCFLSLGCQNDEEVPEILFGGPVDTPALHPGVTGKDGLAFGFTNLYYQNWVDKVEELVNTFTIPESAQSVDPIDGNLPIQANEITYRQAFEYENPQRGCKGLIQKTGLSYGTYFEYFTSCGFLGGESGSFRKVWEGWQHENRRFGYVQHYSTDIRSLDWDIREDKVVFKRLWPDGYQFTFNPKDLSGEIKVGGTNSSTGLSYLRYESKWNADGHGRFTLYRIDGSIEDSGIY